jgi:AAHS family 4-hydroxybenzoate transporter-like MFS transporter
MIEHCDLALVIVRWLGKVACKSKTGGVVDQRAENTIDLAETIDRGELRPRLAWICALLTLALVVDGFDVVMLGFLAPAITQEFSISALALGWLLALGQFGLIVGGVVGGMFADRSGRRPALLASLVLFALGSLASAVASGYETLAAARLCAGFGLGAAAPAVASYLAELLPARWVKQLSVLAFAANLLGGTICAFTGSFVVPEAGWRAMFWIGGLLPLLVVLPLLLALLPESPRFLARKAREPQAVARALDRAGIAHRWTPGALFSIASVARGQGRLRDILAPAWRRETLVLWVMSITLMFTSVGLISLGALLLAQLGVVQAEAIRTMSYYSFAGLTGAFVAAFAVSRLGTRGTLGALLGVALLGLASLVVLAQGDTAAEGWAAAMPMFLIGFGLNGSLIVLFPLVASFYPTEFRSAGSGAVIGVGRMGSTTSLILLSALLGSAGPVATLALCFAMTVLTVTAVLLFRGHAAQSQAVGPTP